MSKQPAQVAGGFRAASRLAGAAGLVAWAVVACSSGDPFGARDGAEAEAGAGGHLAPGPVGNAGRGGSQGGGSGSGGDAGAAGADAAEPEGGAGGQGTAPCGPLDTATDCGSCGNACSEPLAPYCAKTDDGYSCGNPAQALVGQRLALPCINGDELVPELCESVADRENTCPEAGKVVKKSLTITGEAGVVYDVTLRIRGVLEPRIYMGGTASGDHFYVGGTAMADSNYNTYSITVSAPAQTYYLNHDSGVGESYYVFALDHTKVIQVEGGATVKLDIVDPDCAMIRNCKSFVGECSPYVIEGISPAPAGYDGQFVHLDVVSVVKAN